jgi:hypothetical protein
VLHQWVIYDHPADFPEHFVVRHWTVTAGRAQVGPEVWLRPDLAEARDLVDQLSPGAVRLPREPTDDPVIVETWL